MNKFVSGLAEVILSSDSFTGIKQDEAKELIRLSDENLMDIMLLSRMALSKAQAAQAEPAQSESVQPGRGAAHPFTCGIISAKTGRCSENCSFCAQSAHHKTNAPVHGLLDYEALSRRAEELSNNGVHRFGIVTSGHSLNPREYDELCQSIRRIREQYPIQICASLGSLSLEKARMLKDAGVSRYHHNLETSRTYYPMICTTHSYEERVKTVQLALQSGLECCSGGIFGLGESWDDRIEMAEIIRDLGVTCIPMNFLTPIPGTPLEHSPVLPVREALLCLAIFRLLMPEKGMVVCGGREFCLGSMQSQLFNFGANAMMVGNYLVTSGSSLEKDKFILENLGLAGAMSY